MVSLTFNKVPFLILSILSISSAEGRKVRRSRCKAPTIASSKSVNGMALVADPLPTPPTFSVSGKPHTQYNPEKGTPPSSGITLDNDYGSPPTTAPSIYVNPLRPTNTANTLVTSAASVTSSIDSVSVPSGPAQTTTGAASTSAAVQPSATGSGGSNGTSTGQASGKAGISWPVQEKEAAPVAQFFTPESSVSWWYNWNKNWNQGILKSDGVQINGEFVPMLFNPEFLDNSDTFQEGFTDLMGYNEPDLKSNSGVAVHMEPAQAAEKWKTQIVQIRQQYPNVKVHSPAMASNKTWLVEFFKHICPDNAASDGWGDCQYKPDYQAAHMYTTDIEYFKGTLTNGQKDFGLPMVLSEFACYQFGSGPNPSAEEVSTFMEEATTWLDSQDWVIKYAWFGTARNSEYLYGVSENNRLMDNSGQLTNLGKQYINGGKRV